MIKYILSIDYGSSITKYLIMKVDNDDISVYKKDNMYSKGIDEVKDRLLSIFKDNNIDIKNEVELVVTGGYSSSITKDYIGVEPFIVPEYTAISYGVLLLSKLDKAIIANVGTGTCYIYSDLIDIRHMGGTGMGGGSISGIGKKIYKIDDVDMMIEKASMGDKKNVDFFISDVVSDVAFDLDKSLTASNLPKTQYDTKDDDFVLGLYNMICQNLGIEAIQVRDIILKEKKMDKNELPIVFSGTIIKYKLIRDMLDGIAKDLKEKFVYVEDSKYTTVIGAYEYYLLRERKNF